MELNYVVIINDVELNIYITRILFTVYSKVKRADAQV